MLSFVQSQLIPMKEMFSPLSFSEPTTSMPGGINFDDNGSRKSYVPEETSEDHPEDGQDPHATSQEAHEPQSSSDSDDQTAPKERKAQSELFLIVHANPKRKLHHPNNLQVQLVRPKRRDRNGADASNPSNMWDPQHLAGLNRTLSNHSTRSALSSRSGPPTHHRGRRTIPMYNFDYHHIRSKVVLDAGTDQPLARFTRRGIELEGFGTLQPSEIGFLHEDHDIVGLQDDFESPSKTRHSFETDTRQITDPAPENRFLRRMRRLGKSLHSKCVSLPKLKRSSSAQSNLRLTRVNSSQDNTGMLHAIISSYNPQATPGAGSSHGKITTSYVWDITEYDRPDVDEDPIQRTEEYVSNMFSNKQQVRSFHKAVTNVILTRIWKQFSPLGRRGLGAAHPPAEQISVWFEWVRDWNGGADNPHNLYNTDVHGPLSSGSSPDKSTHGDTPVSSISPTSSPSLHPQSDNNLDAPAEMAATTLGIPQQMSPLPTNTDMLPDESTNFSPQRLNVPKEDMLCMYPWTCYLVLNGDARIPIGRLVPAPYHRSIACELQLPSPLPSLRYVPLGVDRKGFSREELRDIVATTALHLTIRENLGSVLVDSEMAH